MALIRAGLADERPPDSFTLTEYAEKYSISPSAAQRQVAKLMNTGKVKKQKTGKCGYYMIV